MFGFSAPPEKACWWDAKAKVVWCRSEHCCAQVSGCAEEVKGILKHRSEFLFFEVGLEPVYISHRPDILSYSMKGRLRPRYYVIKFLKQNGLLDRDLSLYSAVKMTEKVFVEKLICPHKEAAPHLAEDYAAACKGEVPTNFRFTWTKKGYGNWLQCMVQQSYHPACKLLLPVSVFFA